jgi:N-acetylglucosaminyl-diphospho-decaprenol L-rhamnosyltransferase
MTVPAGYSSPIDLSVIIVSWNVRDHLRECLRSIKQCNSKITLEVIVVDAASTDGSVAMIEAEYPDVVLLPQTENVGFPRGNNIGLASARGNNLLLLNPDTEIIGDAFSLMLDYLTNHPEVGALGPQLINSDGSVQSSRRRFPTLATGFFESTWLEGWAPGVLRRYYALDLADDEVAEVDWVVGAAILVPRLVYERTGGMDESYYMYSEELDWCRRIKEAGWRIVYFPAAKVIHHYGKSSEQAITTRQINFQRAKLRYFRKFHGRTPAALLRIFLLLGYFCQIVLEGVKGLLGHKRVVRWQRVRSYVDVLRSGLRPAGY